MDSRYWSQDPLSVELGFWIPIVSGIRIPRAEFWIPKSKILDSTRKISQIPESGFHNMRRYKGPCYGVLYVIFFSVFIFCVNPHINSIWMSLFQVLCLLVGRQGFRLLHLLTDLYQKKLDPCSLTVLSFKEKGTTSSKRISEFSFRISEFSLKTAWKREAVMEKSDFLRRRKITYNFDLRLRRNKSLSVLLFQRTIVDPLTVNVN